MRVVWLFATLSLVSLLCACAPMPPATAASGARIVVVQGSINTTANNGAGQGVNIDAVGALPFGKIKRYTVTLQTALLSTSARRCRPYRGLRRSPGRRIHVRREGCETGSGDGRAVSAPGR